MTSDSAARRQLARRRAAALGGIVGPVAFTGAWAVLGATRPGYSPVSGHISDLAALGTGTRPWMTAGLVAYGIGLTVYGAAAAAAGRRTIGTLAVLSGLASLGVAAFPLGSAWDQRHAAAATIGYATLAAIPLAGAAVHARSRRFGWAALSAAMGLVAVAALFSSASGPQAGLWQRTGLTIADVWLVAHAAVLRNRTRGDAD
ncbi:MAG: hypothetical protein JWM93_1816 [Frankiales bacterium]|nr:hypothetical protein [Frankiales bacterium]